jgi:hypothetical protein
MGDLIIALALYAASVVFVQDLSVCEMQYLPGKQSLLVTPTSAGNLIGRLFSN